MIWLVINEFLKSEKFEELTRMFMAAAERCSLELQVKTNAELLVNIENKSAYMPGNSVLESLIDASDNTVRRPKAVIFWDKDILLARYLEIRGIPVFNSSQCIRVCDDKRETHLCFLQEKVPTPETIFAPMTYRESDFENVDFLQFVEKKLGFPMVVKEAFGSFGEQVYLVRNREELYGRVSACTTTEILFQEYIHESRGHDVRIQVAGDQVVAAMRRCSNTDFRANITAGGSMEAYEPNEEEAVLALAAAKAVGADFAGVDLLFSRKGPVVCEVNSNAHFKNLFDCTGVDTADFIVKYVREKVCGA